MNRDGILRFRAPVFWAPLLSGCATEHPELRFAVAAAGAGIGGFAVRLALWTILLGSVGAAVAALWILLVRTLFPARGRDRRRERSRRIAAWVLPVFLAGTGGGIGFLEGGVRGLEAVLASNALCRKAFGPVGDGAADLTAALYAGLVSRQGPAGEFRICEAFLEAFREDRRELDVADLDLRLRRAGTAGARKAADELRDAARLVWPDASPAVLDRVLRRLSQGVDPRAAALAAGIAGVPSPAILLGPKMMEAARRTGDPSTLSRAELSEVMTRQLIVRPFVLSLRPAVFGFQFPLFLAGLAAVALSTWPLVGTPIFVRRNRTAPPPISGSDDWFP